LTAKIELSVEMVEMYEIDYSLAWKLENGNKLSGNNVVCFKYEYVLFLLSAVSMLDYQWNAGHDDDHVVSINRSINLIID